MLKIKDGTIACGKKCASLFKKYELLLFTLVITGIALFMRIKVIEWISQDYRSFLHPWYTILKENNGFKAFKVLYPQDGSMCNYSPLYMYFLAIFSYTPLRDIVAIKSISIFFDFVLAVFVGLIGRKILKSDFMGCFCYTATLLLPTVFINSAIWGQCDVIFVCFLVMSLYFMMSDLDYLSVACISIAFCLKIQSIFFLPVFVLAVIKKKIRLRTLPLFVLIYLAVGIPALVFGVSPKDTYGMYFTQMGYYKDLTLNTPNFYNWVSNPSEVDRDNFSKAATYAAVGITALAMLPIYKSRFDKNDNKVWIAMTAFFAAMMPYVLPHMHERYWFLSDVACILFIICFPKKWYAPVAVFLPSLYVICRYMFGAGGIELQRMFILMTIGIIVLAITLFEEIKRSGFELPLEATVNSAETITENQTEIATLDSDGATLDVCDTLDLAVENVSDNNEKSLENENNGVELNSQETEESLEKVVKKKTKKNKTKAAVSDELTVTEKIEG